MEDVIRTVKVKLDVPTERCDDLHQTKDQFLHCANTTAEWAWRHPHDYCVTSKPGCHRTVGMPLSGSSNRLIQAASISD